MIVKVTVRTGYTDKGTHNVDVYLSTGLQILRHYFWIPKTKVEFNIATKYSYFKWVNE